MFLRECRLGAVAIDTRLEVESNCLDSRGRFNMAISFSRS
jgi:hypothetical protein